MPIAQTNKAIPSYQRQAISVYLALLIIVLATFCPTFSAQGRPTNEPAVQTKQVTKDIGWIRLSDMTDDQAVWSSRDGLDSLKDCKALVYDLRDNEGGSFANALKFIEQLLDNGPIATVDAHVPQENYWFNKTYRLDGSSLTVQDNTSASAPEYENREFNMLAYRPLVILVDGDTRGGAELLVAAMLDSQGSPAKILGTTTYGNAAENIWVTTKSGRQYLVQDARFSGPNGECIGSGNGSCSQGFEPESGMIVEANKDIVYGSANDNQLAAAVNYLNSQLKRKSLAAPGEQKHSVF